MSVLVDAVIYERTTGEILCVRSGRESDIKYEAELNNAGVIIGTADINKHYVDITGVPFTIRERPVMNIKQSKATIKADGKDTVKITGLPIPCKITFGGISEGARLPEIMYEVTDGRLEWGTLLPQEYPISIEAFPFITWTGRIIALTLPVTEPAPTEDEVLHAQKMAETQEVREFILGVMEVLNVENNTQTK